MEYNTFGKFRRIVHILLIHDQPEEAELILGALQSQGLAPSLTRVESIPEIRAELAPDPEVVIYDHSIDQVPLGDVLSIVREHDPDLPFIVVTAETIDHYAVSVLG